jgi:membrane protease subunit HflK
MAKSRNPFEHHHHHHEPGDDHDEVRVEMDPAQKSLADALRVSFGILKIAMLVLLVLYLFSNTFNVKSQEKAVRLRFGKLVGDVLEQGGPYFALPYPIEEVVKIPTTPRAMSIRREFWYELTAADAGRNIDEIAEGKQGPLNPERDGYLVTGDANIVHTQWALTYHVDDPIKYLASVGDAAVADQIVRRAAEEGVVKFVAGLTADEVYKGSGSMSQARALMQQGLDGMQTGLVIDPESISMSSHSVPLPTRSAFQAVLNAESQKGQQVEAAQQERARILGEAAGEAHDKLLTLIEKIEIASEASVVPDELDGLNSQLRQAMADLTIDGLPVGGQVAESINSAATYRTSIVEQVKGDAEMFDQLLKDYRLNPQIVRNRLWQEARQRILGSEEIETFYVGDGQVRLDINRDPKVQREREKRRLKLEEEQRRAGVGR